MHFTVRLLACGLGMQAGHVCMTSSMLSEQYFLSQYRDCLMLDPYEMTTNGYLSSKPPASLPVVKPDESSVCLSSPLELR